MEKRVVFRSAWLPYVLVAPQIAITILFFFWPAAQAVYYSFLVQDAFGLSTQFVWFQNFQELFANEHYLASFKITAIFSALVACSGLAISLVLAVMADHVLRGASRTRRSSSGRTPSRRPSPASSGHSCSPRRSASRPSI